MSFSSDLLGFVNQEPQMMFPSSNYNGNDLFSHTPFYNYTTNPNSSKHLDEQYCHPSFLHLSSPLFHYELENLEELEDHEVFSFHNPQQSIKGTDDSVPNFHGDESNSIEKSKSKAMKIMEKVSTTTTTTGGGKKKSGKKDRHSKINTAQGLRDRRMRLSLKVAKEFFDLQDKLGYDKASKTVEWLLTQAKPEINNFMRSCNNAAKSSASSATNSECEVVSQINNSETSICAKNKERKVRQQSSPKNAFRGGPLPKETREKARARARERTRMKRCDHHHQEATTYNDYDQLILLSSWSPFEAQDSLMAQVQTTTTTTSSHEGMDKYWSNSTFPSNFGYSTPGIPQQVSTYKKLNSIYVYEKIKYTTL